MTLAEIKNRLIDAHRSGDWELAKELSQMKEKAKKKERRIGHCRDCGVAISGGHRDLCVMHRNIHRFYGRAVAAAIMLLFGLASFAAPAASTGQVTLGWSYDFVANPTVTSFNVYYGTNATAIANWDGNTNQCHCYQLGVNTASKLLTVTIGGLVRGATYYFNVTPQDASTGEGPYCNEVRAAIPSKPGKANGLTVISVQ